MNPKFLFVLATVLLLGCAREKKTTSTLLHFVPKNASLVIKINDIAALKSELKNNGFLSKLKGSTLYQKVFETIKNLDYVKPSSESLLVFTELGKENFEFLFIAQYTEAMLDLEGLTDKSVETLTYESNTLQKYTLNGTAFFTTHKENILIGSSSQLLLENLIRSTPVPNTSLYNLYKVSNGNKSASVFINTKHSDALLASIMKPGNHIMASQFSDWLSLDMDISQDHLHLIGIATSNDSLKNFVNLFKGTGALTNITPLFAPLSSNAVLSYSFADYKQFSRNQQRYLDRSVPVDTIFNTVEEIGSIFLNGRKAIVLNTFGSETIAAFLNDLRTASLDYQGAEIMTLRETEFINEIFAPLVKNFSAKYCTILDNAFIFSTEMETVQTIISNYKSASTFNNTPTYITASSVLADESNILFIANTDGFLDILQEDLAESVHKDISDQGISNYLFASQMVADEDFYHLNSVVQKIEKEGKGSGVSQVFTLQLDNNIASFPQFVTDHRSNNKEIVVQDTENNLYLISHEGKILWKKQLQGKIQGKVEQVDIYKNGRLQLAFTTNDQFLILDRNGKEVAPFTKTFEGGNLNPLAVFDYDGNKNYRFVVTQGTKVRMYDSKMDIVGGFKYTDAAKPIIGPPQHFRKGSRDYLIFLLEDGTLKILDRVGKDRIVVPGKFDFSGNGLYVYNDKFTFTDTKGILHQVDDSGKIGKTRLDLAKEHGMDATSKTLAVMNDNILRIRGKQVELDLGVYSKPKIFYIKDKIYVAVTDIQNQKIYLFDSNAVAIPHFPLFGTSVIDLADMDGDKKLELVAKDMDNSLIVYKIY
jgi:REP element-mobilizing transposase RayT